MSVNFRLDNKVALVMGGAGGIGKALVEGLSRQGAKVVISDFNTKAQDETAKEAIKIPLLLSISCIAAGLGATG